ncbi:DUF4352 domain-containing protein [Candidatus Binatia bacterium]|nr:DUF4352 domain-containing protein [Candidatus Binatia bacterium]
MEPEPTTKEVWGEKGDPANVLTRILGWIVGLPLILLGLVGGLGGEAFGWFVVLFGGLVFPPVHSFTQRRFDFRLTTGQRALGCVLAFVGMMATVPKQPQTEGAAPTVPSAPVAAAKQEQPAAAAPAAAVNTLVIGDTFRLGDFTYRVTRVGTADTLGAQYAHENAGPNATFVVVQYEITNEGKETHTGLADDFELLDSAGRKFRPSSRGSTAFMMAGGNDDFLLTELQPGITKPSVQVFEIPLAALKGLRLRVPEKGFFGSDEVVVDLTRTRTSR